MIWLTGDTHGDFSRLSRGGFPPQMDMTRDDGVVILGDCGLHWRNDEIYEHWLEWLRSRSFTLLFIDGNHDNFDWLDSLPVSQWRGGKVHRIAPNIFHLMRGQVFEIAGKTFWVMGGAWSPDFAWRVPWQSWWAREELSEEEADEG